MLISSRNSLRYAQTCVCVYMYVFCYCCSVAKSCLTLFDPMDCSMPGSSVLHCLPEFTQTHAHRVGDAIQPSHPLSSPSPPAFNLSHHRGLYQWAGSLHQVPKYWSFSFSISVSNEYSGWFPLGWTGRIFWLSKGLSRIYMHVSIEWHLFL